MMTGVDLVPRPIGVGSRDPWPPAELDLLPAYSTHVDGRDLGGRAESTFGVLDAL